MRRDTKTVGIILLRIDGLVYRSTVRKLRGVGTRSGPPRGEAARLSTGSGQRGNVAKWRGGCWGVGGRVLTAILVGCEGLSLFRDRAYYCAMEPTEYFYWKDQDHWLGYRRDCPDYWTQGGCLEDLTAHLKNLALDVGLCRTQGFC